MTDLTDHELERYSRQILLPQFDIAGQLALKASKVLIVGMGGLGSPAALYLAAAGIGHLHCVDDDRVDLSNLQRQVLHQQDSIGVSKVASAKAQLLNVNSTITIKADCQRLEGEALQRAVLAADAVLDCTDNFETRIAINHACIRSKTPLVSGAAIRFEGQVATFDLRQNDSPCYQCLYGMLGNQALSCSESGVLSPVVGVIGAYQALEVIKVISGVGQAMTGRVQFFDGLRSDWREFRLKKDLACPACSV